MNDPGLSRHLGPVKAPDELWDRVRGRAERGEPSNRTTRPTAITWRWVAVSMATVAVVAGITVWLNRPLSIEELAVRALDHGPEQMEFRSADLTELRTWVKGATGLDLPLRGQPAPSVHLIGAHLARTGVPTAEIAYRIGDTDARLVISKAPPDGDGRHTFIKSGSYHGANFQSWTMRGQMYTIASSGMSANARMGCMLCHSTGAPRTSVN